MLEFNSAKVQVVPPNPPPVRTPIPELHLQRLLERRLWLHGFDAAAPSNTCRSVRILKPDNIGGNTIPGYRGPNLILEDGQTTTTSSPSLIFYGEDDVWFVELLLWIPGPGPGDFLHGFDDPSDGVADILDFYFGDPSRMRLCEGPTEDEIRAGRLAFLASDIVDESCRQPGCAERRVRLSLFCPQHHLAMLSRKLSDEANPDS